MTLLDPFSIDLDKTTLIEASAGTGKTYTITTLFCRMVAQGMPVESILVVTFTEAAAAELKLRIRQRMNTVLNRLEYLYTNNYETSDDEDDLISYLMKTDDIPKILDFFWIALQSFDQASVFTIHSFCLKVLKENAFEGRYPFDVELKTDISRYLHQVVYDFFLKEIYPLDPLFLKFLEKNSITPDYFITHLGSLARQKKIRRIPECDQFSDSFDRYRDLLEKIKESLQQNSSEIESMLISHPGIKHTSYSKRWVPSWIEQSCKMLSSDLSCCIIKMTPDGDKLYKFTKNAIAMHQKGDQSLPEHPFFDLCQELADVYQEFESNLIVLKHSFFSFVSKAFEQIKETEGICFFDDLINDVSTALAGPQAQLITGNIRSIYNACLIDEFQDTDPVQYHIFSTLFSIHNFPFFMIGDPKQAIYAFRGGDIFAYLKASADCHQQFTLPVNYRSAPRLVKAVNDIFSYVENPFVFEKIAYTKVDTPEKSHDRLCDDNKIIAPMHLLYCDAATWQQNMQDDQSLLTGTAVKMVVPGLIAQDIKALLHSDIKLCEKKDDLESGRAVNEGDIAVIVRTNEQAQKIQDALVKIGIPAYTSSSDSVYESTEAMELFDILNAICFSKNPKLIKGALCTRIFGGSVYKVATLSSESNTLLTWQVRFSQFYRTWQEEGFISMIQSLLHAEWALLREDGDIDERALTNYYHLAELVSSHSVEIKSSPEVLLRWYEQQLSSETRESSENELRLETDRDAINIVTIHKSKGLEYPVVYLPYMWEPGKKRTTSKDILFHDPACDDTLTIDLGSSRKEFSILQEQNEQEAESRRLLYVALTRASAMCRIFWPPVKDCDLSAFGRILHPEKIKEKTQVLNDLKNLSQKSAANIMVHDQLFQAICKNRSDRINQDYLLDEILKVPDNFQSTWQVKSFSSVSRVESIEGAGLPIQKESKVLEDDIITLKNFPKGAMPGNLFHAIFETIDFTGDIHHFEQIAQICFQQYGFNKGEHLSDVVTALEQIFSTPLKTPDQEIFLKDIAPSHRINEMEFLYPVEKMSCQAVKEVMLKTLPETARLSYEDSVKNLTFKDLSGFMKGFIDLIFCYNDRWYIADYKSNYLGPSYHDYHPVNIEREMSSHHYYLQYYIYTAALDRYLSLRIPDYDYTRHFGGVFYLFFRGMRPLNRSQSGVYFHRPHQSALSFSI